MAFDDELLAPIRSLDASLHSLAEEDAALRATIQEQLDAVRERARSVEEKRTAALTAVLQKVTVEDLSDPVRALLIYGYGWADGRGTSAFEPVLQLVAEGSYARLDYSWYTDPSGTVTLPGLHIFAPPLGEIDPAKFARTVEIIQSLYPAQQELYDEIVITLSRYDDWYLSYSPERQVWGLLRHKHSDVYYRAEADLEPVLRAGLTRVAEVPAEETSSGY